MEWLADGTVTVELFLPTSQRIAEFAALEFAKSMNLKDAEVIHSEMMHVSEGTRIQIKGTLDYTVDIDKLVIPPELTVRDGPVRLLLSCVPKNTL